MTDTIRTSSRSPREFAVGQFVFRDPLIYDFYDVVAEAILETQNEGVSPVRVRVRSWQEGSLIRVRLNAIMNARCTLSPWHWCATRFTRSEPDVVYAWIKTIQTTAEFLVHYRYFSADRVMKMLEEPKISVKKLPAQRYRGVRGIEIIDE